MGVSTKLYNKVPCICFNFNKLQGINPATISMRTAIISSIGTMAATKNDGLL